MAWTDDRVEVLTKLWAEGLSASQIAKQLGGVTRNAVIGKVHRLGLSGRAKPSRPATIRTTKPSAPRTRTTARTTTVTTPSAPARTARQAPAKPPTPPVEAKPLPSGEYATIMTIRDHMCKWPIGDPSKSDFRFCGRKTDPSTPYCDAHSSVAYQPSRRRYPGQKTLGQTTMKHLQKR
ncbi:GcrA family cell cycle regulator [Fretibacter rubidus]|uniref:GcrA family cell cycle regulator n=1 Tax=Fretibacter rubidus TaxID=570162 RepID=UPI00352B8B67